jgi:hypothetical protein
MPWTVADVERFKKGLSDEEKQKWVKLANAIFESCMEQEDAKQSECERLAIATASSKVGDHEDSMAFTEKPWDGDKSRFTIEQLLNAVPKAIAAWARKKAKENPSGEVIKEHLKLPYREPDGTININAVRNALARLPQTEGLPDDVKAAAKAELERILEEYRKRKGDSFVTRYDQADVTLREENGLLIGEIALAKPDVYPYYDPTDGKVHYEFKPPEEILTDEFLQQTCLLPITDEHPPEGEVNDRNIHRLIKGMTGTSPRIEGNLVVNVGAVYDPALKEQIKRGDKRQVSIGFRTVVVDREGEFNGKKYDRVQTKIRLNHLAFTKAGRCGEQCAIKADGGQQMFTLKIGKDTVTFDCPVQDQAFIEKMQPVFAEAQAKIDAIVAKALEVAEAGEKLDAENKALRQKLESLSKSDVAVVDAMRQRAEARAAELQKQLDSTKAELERAQAELSTLRGQLKAQQDLKDALAKQAQEIMAKADAIVDERLKLIQYARSKQPYYQHTGKSNLEIKRDLVKMINPQLATDSVSETELDAYLKAWMDLDEHIERVKETALQNVARRVGLDARSRSEASELRERTLKLYQGNK